MEENGLAITESVSKDTSDEAGALSIASVTEVVYSHLRTQILEGTPADRPLKLNDVAAKLGVSTTPVRSAIERLAFEGLVIMRGRKGASVAPLSLNSFRDIYTIRRALEGTAASLAAPMLSDVEIARMRERIDLLGEIAHSGRPQVDLYVKSEWEMHKICYAAPGYPRLLKEIETYRRQGERYFRLAFAQGVNVLDDLENQRAFCDACCARDAVGAATMAELLLDVTVTTVAPLLRDLTSMLRDSH